MTVHRHGGLENPPPRAEDRHGAEWDSRGDRGMNEVKDIEFTQIAADCDSITLWDCSPFASRQCPQLVSPRQKSISTL